MSQQRIGGWSLNLAVAGTVAVFVPGLTIELALMLLSRWINDDPGRIWDVSFGAMYGSWLSGLVLLITALCMGCRSRNTWMGMSSLILSATVLIGIAGWVGWTFFELFH